MRVLERWSMGAAALLLPCGGCAQNDARGERTAEAASAATAHNGDELNGIFFNGIFFNGIFFNGPELDPLPLAGLRLDGHPLPGASLAGGTLVSAHAGDLTGAELYGSITNGTFITLRIDAITPGDAPDISLYTVSYTTPGSDVSTPLCGADALGAPVQAIPLSGAWDDSAGTPTGGAHLDEPGAFTFACEGYALAKCVELGYAPWRTVTECRAPGTCHQLSLADFHQACTRMIRADYCGDGTSTTRNGTTVDLWDDDGIQADTETAWPFEAEWSTGGATCLITPRHTTIEGTGESVLTFVHDHCPARYEAPGCDGTGSTFFPASGYTTPLGVRSLLRTRVDGTAVP
jgi:hypothetical protein